MRQRRSMYMSAFYGMVQGNRGASTKGGSKNSGFVASCQSYDGSVITRMWYDENDNLMVSIAISEGSSTYGDKVFVGSLEELKAKLQA
ncbi:MAG: hypothetical protein LIR50_19215 [Bacillota bacterium]|nr:hypothetical protein [Bacillota bacterium]